jgi:hypothetical protein
MENMNKKHMVRGQGKKSWSFGAFSTLSFFEKFLF